MVFLSIYIFFGLSLQQMIILSLIVKRARVKTLVKDKRAAMEAFGTYVEVDASTHAKSFDFNFFQSVEFIFSFLSLIWPVLF